MKKYSFGSCECAITQAYVTSDSNYFYTLVNENYHNILSDEISKQRDISKETGKLIDDTSRFFCVKVHMKYTSKEAMTMDIYSTIFSKDTNNEILFLGFLMFIDKSFSIHKLDNIYLEPNEEYDMWFSIIFQIILVTTLIMLKVIFKIITTIIVIMAT